MSTHTISEVFDTPSLISSLSTFSNDRSADRALESGKDQDNSVLDPSLSPALFLRVSAAADYFSSNRTLMNYPPPVLVDISEF